MSVVRAVLWDMDGTLVDSEELHWRAWRETMADEGISITHDQFLSSFGQRNDSIIPLWLGAGAAPERVRKIESAKEDRFRRLVRDAGVLPLPGAVAWVKRLKRERLATGSCLVGTARECRGGSGGDGSRELFSGHRFR